MFMFMVYGLLLNATHLHDGGNGFVFSLLSLLLLTAKKTVGSGNIWVNWSIPKILAFNFLIKC